MATNRPDTRLARLLQAVPATERSASPNATMDLTIELARVRAAAHTMAYALGAVAIFSSDDFLRREAEEALDRAVLILS